jgi:hypothetical protein
MEDDAVEAFEAIGVKKRNRQGLLLGGSDPLC